MSTDRAQFLAEQIEIIEDASGKTIQAIRRGDTEDMKRQTFRAKRAGDSIKALFAELDKKLSEKEATNADS